ncbi:MAG: hypothetical protein WC823_00695 [Parcubacteria group bacterium]
MRELLQRQSALQKEINNLAKSFDKNALDMKLVDLQNVNAEIAIRQEDLGSITASISAIAESFEMHSQSAFKETSEDIAKREQANGGLRTAQEDQANKVVARDAAKKSFWPFGKAKRIEAAEADLMQSKEGIEKAERDIIVTEEQIRLDVRSRVHNARLDQSYLAIAELVGSALKVLSSDIQELNEGIVTTQGSLTDAIAKRASVSEEMKGMKESVQKLADDILAKKADMKDMPDRLDPAYQKMSVEVDNLELKWKSNNDRLALLENTFSNLDIAIKSYKGSLGAMQMAVKLANNENEKFRIIKRKARDIGNNITMLLKAVTRASVNDGLDRGVNAMEIAVFRTAKQVAVASSGQIIEMVKRNIEVMDQLNGIDTTGDAVLAEQSKEYAESVEKMRRGYSKITPNIPGISVLAKEEEKSGQPVVKEEDDAF